MSNITNNTTSLQEVLEALQNKAAGGGIDTSDATATADEIFLDKTAYVDGQKLTGTFTIDDELSTQDNLITQIQTALEGKSAGDGNAQLNLQDKTVTENGTYTADSGYDGLGTVIVSVPEIVPILQEKTVTPSKSAQEVIADNGYNGLSKVNVKAIPSEYIIPSGTQTIIENGTYDVTTNESVTVNVASSSGGGGVETCVVTINEGMAFDIPTFYYTDANTFTVKTLTSASGSFTIPKNTIVVMEGWSSTCTYTECIQLFNMYGLAAYHVTGSAIFTVYTG